MEKTVCSAYSGLVPMSPKTTPSAASTSPRPACPPGPGPAGACSAVCDATTDSVTVASSPARRTSVVPSAVQRARSDAGEPVRPEGLEQRAGPAAHDLVGEQLADDQAEGGSAVRERDREAGDVRDLPEDRAPVAGDGLAAHAVGGRGELRGAGEHPGGLPPQPLHRGVADVEAAVVPGDDLRLRPAGVQHQPAVRRRAD